jgi:hypothetical protein
VVRGLRSRATLFVTAGHRMHPAHHGILDVVTVFNDDFSRWHRPLQTPSLSSVCEDRSNRVIVTFGFEHITILRLSDLLLLRH